MKGTLTCLRVVVKACRLARACCRLSSIISRCASLSCRGGSEASRPAKARCWFSLILCRCSGVICVCSGVSCRRAVVSAGLSGWENRAKWSCDTTARHACTPIEFESGSGGHARAGAGAPCLCQSTQHRTCMVSSAQQQPEVGCSPCRTKTRLSQREGDHSYDVPRGLSYDSSGGVTPHPA